MELYQMTEQFNELFDRFDEIDNYIPDTDEFGRYIDGNGEIIEDLEAFREKLRSAWFDTLVGLEAEFNDKAENIAVYLKSLYIEAAAMHDEEKTLKARRMVIEQRADRLKKHLINSMNAIGVKKIDMPRARLTIRKNPESVIVDDELGFIRWAQENANMLLKVKLPDIKKAETKRLIQAGESLPYVHLDRTESLIIK